MLPHRVYVVFEQISDSTEVWRGRIGSSWERGGIPIRNHPSPLVVIDWERWEIPTRNDRSPPIFVAVADTAWEEGIWDAKSATDSEQNNASGVRFWMLETMISQRSIPLRLIPAKLIQEESILARWTWFVDIPKVEGSTWQSRNAQALELAKVEILRTYRNARFEQ